MEIVYTDHARDRILQRKIKKRWVEEALRNRDVTKNGKDNRNIAVKNINGEKISVVYVVENEDYVIITTYWGE